MKISFKSHVLSAIVFCCVVATLAGQEIPNNFLALSPWSPGFARGPFLTVVDSCMHVVSSLIPLHIFSTVAYSVVPSVLEVISPTHGVGDDLLLAVPDILFRVIPSFAHLLFNIILIPFRLLLIPVFLLLWPLQFLIRVAWFLNGFRPRPLLRLRLLLSNLFRRPFLRFLNSAATRTRINFNRLVSLVRPTNLIRARLGVVRVAGPILGFLAGILLSIRPRIQNLLRTLWLALRRIFTPGLLAVLQPWRPTILARIRMALQRLFRPGFFRLIRPFAPWERFRMRFLG